MQIANFKDPKAEDLGKNRTLTLQKRRCIRILEPKTTVTRSACKLYLETTLTDLQVRNLRVQCLPRNTQPIGCT